MVKRATLDLSGIKNLKTKTKNLQSRSVEFGFITSKWHSTSRLPNSVIATMLEFGVRKDDGGWRIPPRPALGHTVTKLKKDHSRFESVIRRPLAAYLEGKGSPTGLLNLTGTHLANRYSETMEYWKFQGTQYTSNSPATVRIKGFDMPYTHTGELVDSTEHQIKIR